MNCFNYKLCAILYMPRQIIYHEFTNDIFNYSHTKSQCYV